MTKMESSMKLSFTEFVYKFYLKKRATMKNKQKKLNKLGLETNIYIRESQSTTKDRILNLHQTKGTH